jgi:hypothetical protein
VSEEAERGGRPGAERRARKRQKEENAGRDCANMKELTSVLLERGEPSLSGFRGYGGGAPVVSPERSEGGDRYWKSFYLTTPYLRFQIHRTAPTIPPNKNPA